jgi:hypothetical protein
MSNKPPIVVLGVILSERPEGIRTLAISSKTGEFEFEFSDEQWTRLADSARWFSKHVTLVNGATHDNKESA